MTLESRQKLRALLLTHESYRQFPYEDSTSHLTIGIGRNITDRGISQSEAFILLDDDIIYFSSKLSQLYNFFDDLTDNRKIALIDMCFNLGLNGFSKFGQMLGCLRIHDYDGASYEMINSKWAHQVKERALTLAHIIKTGEL